MSMCAPLSSTAKCCPDQRSYMYAMSSPRLQFARLNASKITNSFNRKVLKASHPSRHSLTVASSGVRTAPVSKVQHALTAIVGFCLAVAIAASPAAAEETFSGIPRIVDGDTIVVRHMAFINIKIVLLTLRSTRLVISKAAASILSQSHLSAKGTVSFLQVAGIRVRLFGIDAPESKQACKNTGGAQYTCGETICIYLPVCV